MTICLMFGMFRSIQVVSLVGLKIGYLDYLIEII